MKYYSFPYYVQSKQVIIKVSEGELLHPLKMLSRSKIHPELIIFSKESTCEKN